MKDDENYRLILNCISKVGTLWTHCLKHYPTRRMPSLFLPFLGKCANASRLTSHSFATSSCSSETMPRMSMGYSQESSVKSVHLPSYNTSTKQTTNRLAILNMHYFNSANGCICFILSLLFYFFLERQQNTFESMLT